MKRGISKKIEEFEIKHKIILFILVIFLTIIITRIIVLVKDPNLIIKGYELHHFYYGIILLIISNLLMLFGKKNFNIYFLLSAISIGLITDEFLYVAGGFGNKNVYFSTLPSAIAFSGIILLIAFFIKNFSRT
ncbi:hypothetical protein A3K73_08975 [Candidatus Pacearchaeota archaeon RBG_13_36_9]|nr:MAG: hypothetical protein A3K73_08975 [Candidatus Pacearchaeota archaeon RBG_13_36_9]